MAHKPENVLPVVKGPRSLEVVTQMAQSLGDEGHAATISGGGHRGPTLPAASPWAPRSQDERLEVPCWHLCHHPRESACCIFPG